MLYESQFTSNMAHISICEDGNYVAASGDDWVYLFDINATEIWKWRALGNVNSISVSRDGSFIIAGDGKGYVYCLDFNGTLIWDKKFEGSHQYDHVSIDVSLSTINNYIALGIYNFSYYASTSYHFAVMNMYGNWVVQPKTIYSLTDDISISHNAEFVFTPAGMEGVRIYNINGELISSLQVREYAYDVDNALNGTCLVVGSDDMRVYLFKKTS